MMLSWIKYRVAMTGETHTYRFPRPTGHHKNIAALYAPKERLLALQQALIFALDGLDNSDISHAALYFADSAGDNWLIERSPSATRLSRNGKEVPTGGTPAMLRALWDFDPDQGRGLTSTSVSSYDLVDVGSELLATSQVPGRQPVQGASSLRQRHHELV